MTATIRKKPGVTAVFLDRINDRKNPLNARTVSLNKLQTSNLLSLKFLANAHAYRVPTEDYVEKVVKTVIFLSPVLPELLLR